MPLRCSELLIAYAPLDAETATLEIELLSDDERTRAARFAFEIHRRRFIAARIFLRRALGRLTGRAPGRLVFAYEPGGRPLLAIPNAPEFNLAHSNGVALLAVIASGAVGVDVEKTKPLSDSDAVAANTMHPSELAAFHALPERERLAAFYRHWTRKEALLKAVGAGLSAEPRNFHVGLGKTPDPSTHHVRAQDCEIIDISAPAGYAAALCAPRGVCVRRVPDLETTRL
jgi:4'-phosphopantetheinyl transferase